MNDLPVLVAHRIDHHLQIDGDLSKPVWKHIEPALLRPTTGEPQTVQRTELRACWSVDWLYLAFDCADRDVWGSYTGRDDPLYEEEVVEAFLCPTGDLTHYIEIEVSPRNTVFDACIHSPDLHRNAMQVDKEWNLEGLSTAVSVRGTLDRRDDVDQGWSAEIAIPFSGLPGAAPPVRGSEWRANFYRIDRAEPPEFTAWSPTLQVPADFHVPRQFGYLLFS